MKVLIVYKKSFLESHAVHESREGCELDSVEYQVDVGRLWIVRTSHE